MHWKRWSSITSATILSACLGFSSAGATCWELGLRVQNTSGSWVQTPIQVWAPSCATAPIATGTSSSTPDGQGVNFRINLNSVCSGTTTLSPEVLYVIEFPNWGNKTFYFEGHLIPGQPVDDIYTVTPSALTWYSGAGVQEAWGYPSASHSALCLDLVVYEEIPIGSKTTYEMRATGSGASSYSFS